MKKYIFELRILALIRMHLWTSYLLCMAQCIYELRTILCMKQNVFMNLVSFSEWNRMYLWTSFHYLHETKGIYELRIISCTKQNVFVNFVSFSAWNKMYLCTSYHCVYETKYFWISYHFVHETECIYELRIICCMKQNVFMNFLSLCAWNRMYLWTSYNFLQETERIYELRIIFCTKQNVFMNFVPFCAWNNVFLNFISFVARNRTCLWTSYHFCIWEILFPHTILIDSSLSWRSVCFLRRHLHF